MKDIYQSIPLTMNDTSKRFELEVDHHTAFIEYKEKDDLLYLIHTEVPAPLEGRGAGSALVEKTLQMIEGRKQKIVPLCSFVASFIKRHPEWDAIVYTG